MHTLNDGGKLTILLVPCMQPPTPPHLPKPESIVIVRGFHQIKSCQATITSLCNDPVAESQNNFDCIVNCVNHQS